MPSGSITISPGRTLSAGAVTLSMLNDLGNPTARVDEGAITNRELADGAFSGTLFSAGGVNESKIEPGDEAYQLLRTDSSASLVEWVDPSLIRTPSGVYVPFGGSTPPTGWLDCDGSAVSRDTYAELFAVIGTTFGVGNGSTTFNLPTVADNIIRQ